MGSTQARSLKTNTFLVHFNLTRILFLSFVNGGSVQCGVTGPKGNYLGLLGYNKIHSCSHSWLAMASSPSAQDVADAINSIMRMDDEQDKQALLEVIDLYFTNPSPRSSSGGDRESISTVERGERCIINNAIT